MNRETRASDPPGETYVGCLACWLQANYGDAGGKLHNGLGDNCPDNWPDELSDPEASWALRDVTR